MNAPYRRTSLLSLLLLCLLSVAAPKAHADAILLIEEPINFLGHLSSTGHSALLLDHLCSDDHLHMRPCRPGEDGAVVGRYQGIRGYDWLAISPDAYLYAADAPPFTAPEIPDYATVSYVDTLREQYRTDHLRTLAPDPKDEYWIQLVGASYRRRILCIRVQTTPEQDRRLMHWLNARRNRTHFNFFLNNCADFTRQALNVLFPGAVHRNILFDAGMTTPKQIAASLHHYAERHPALGFELGVIPQVPGDLPRSGRLYGVTESFSKTKLYLYPLAILQPVGIGSVIASGFADRRYSIQAEGRNAPELAPDTLEPLTATAGMEGTAP